MTLVAVVNAIRKLVPYGVAAYDRIDKLIEDYAKKEGVSKAEARRQVRRETEKHGINLGNALKSGGKKAAKAGKTAGKKTAKAGKKAVKKLT